MTRRDQERHRLAVARALLNASRPLILSESALLEEPAVARLARERYADELLREELALGDLVREAGHDVLRRLGDDTRLRRESAVLEAVLAGGSITAAAAALGLSREHLSNTAWKTVTGWVTDVLDEQCRVARARDRGS